MTVDLRLSWRRSTRGSLKIVSALGSFIAMARRLEAFERLSSPHVEPRGVQIGYRTTFGAQPSAISFELEFPNEWRCK